ncbi:hypothetical protein NDN08_006878 [Rhodosorus marinus]|uniref:RRM domain-containing protein n=1 Tax=Rhodosorus marinus TaxID=101924 RepID=A0AAV8UJ39_9RHOD|nr:hypothetical protein NDN08_006878 [Rhodosorus marinus]
MEEGAQAKAEGEGSPVENEAVNAGNEVAVEGGNVETEEQATGAGGENGAVAEGAGVEGGVDPAEEEDLDAALEDVKKKLKEWEEDEAAKLDDIQEASAQEGSAGATVQQSDLDSRSIYVGNVDYSATPAELQAHFQDCGQINRITILCNKATGQPKGFAYIEFAEEEAVSNATILNESTFKGRQIKVSPKRTNIPGVSTTERGRGRGRGRGRVFRGSYRAGYRGRHAPY